MTAEHSTSTIVSENRRLAAVMFIDMVGYSAIMQSDQVRAQNAVDTVWALLTPVVDEFGGQQIRRFGDGMLLTFGGALPAVRTALKMFETLAARNQGREDEDKLRVRIGVHLGDIGDRTTGEIFGNGVNIASRLESLAPPGGVAISPHVRDQLLNVLDHPIKSLGVKSLKNIQEPMEVFCLAGPECSSADLAKACAAGEMPARRWQFGSASFDERARELKVSGHVQTLEREALEVLRCLLVHAGEVVTVEELQGAAGMASAAKLEQRIGELRQALRDKAGEQIRLQPGYGYRLAVGVAVEAAPSEQVTRLDFQAGDRPPMRPLWTLEKMLGQGGQGEVWLGRHDKTHEARVYKFALNPEQLSSLKREITLSRVLHDTAQSQYFVRVLDWNLERPPFFLECQYSGSGDLVSWAQAQGGIAAVPLATRLELLTQVAEALASAHSVGVLHKDLKPANVLIDQGRDGSPQIKLADFGSGGVLDSQHLDELGITQMGFTRASLSNSESSGGTPIYAAPELLAGQVATVQADVYSLGVMLYQFIACDLRKPLTAGWEADVEDELLREDIAAAAHGNPRQRLADAAGFARRLRELEQRREQRRSEREAERESRQAAAQLATFRSRRRWVLALIASLVIGLGLALQQQLRAQAAAEASQAVADFLGKDLFAVVGEKPLSDFTVHELLKSAAENLDKRDGQLPQVAAQLHAALGQAFYAVNDFPAADKHLDIALRRFEESEQAGSERALEAATTLFSIIRTDRQRTAQTRDRFLRVLALGRESLGELDPRILSLGLELALARTLDGYWTEGRQQLEALLSAAEAAPVGLEGLIVDARIRLGELLTQFGEFEHAEQTLRAALSLSIDTEGVPPLKEAAVRFFLAQVLLERGRYDAALAELARCREIAERWMPPGTTAVSFQNDFLEGQIRLARGESASGLSLIESSAQGLIDLFGENLPLQSLAQRASIVADAYISNGRFADAKAALEPVMQKIQGDEMKRPWVASTQLRMVEALLLTGQASEARELLSRIKLDDIEFAGELLPLRARQQRMTGLLALSEGNRAAGRAALANAGKLLATLYGAEHRHTRQVDEELAGIPP